MSFFTDSNEVSGSISRLFAQSSPPAPPASRSLRRPSSKSGHSSTRKSSGRKKSSLSRQASGSTSSIDRAAESARRTRIKRQAAKTAPAEPQSSSNIVVRGLKFIFNKLNPFSVVDTPDPCEGASENSPLTTVPPMSSSHSLPSLSYGMDHVEFAPYTSAVMHNVECLPPFYEDYMPSWFAETGGILEMGRVYPKERHFTIREMVERVQRKEAAELEKERQEDKLDLEERRELLEAGWSAAQRVLLDSNEDFRARLQAEEEYLLKVLGFTMSQTSRNRYHRDRTTKSRRIGNRVHPYATRGRPERYRTRFFNPSLVFLGPAFDLSDLDDSHVSVFELFKRYEQTWAVLSNPRNKMKLTFRNVPWPVKVAPQAPGDIHTQDVWDFLLLGNFGADERAALDCAEVGDDELGRWSANSVFKLILSRVSDEEDREAIRMGAWKVEKALLKLSSCKPSPGQRDCFFF